MSYSSSSQKGFSLVEAMIVAAVSVVVFGALISAYHYSFKLMSDSRAKLSALSVANDRMEYFRSLPYDAVGTVFGIPSGNVPQNSTTSLNGIKFNERVLVEYVDDPSDGLGVLDSNGIIADYKRLKLEYTWEIRGATSSISLISNIVPRSVETTAGGGTVRVNVIDENSQLLPGASVRLINSTTASLIDVTRVTDANGAALFSGAPAASNYEVVVTANIGGQNYSTAQTYEATVANPNPTVASFSVIEADVSTLTFQIGELSDLDILTRSAITEGTFLEEFSDLVAVDSSTAVETNSGKLKLVNTLGAYETNGIAYLGPIGPTPLLQWETARVAVDVPVNTTHKVQFFTGVTTGPYNLIPDSDLSGNAVGFTDTIIDLSFLDVLTYPTIFVGVTLNTSDTNITPAVDEISIYYRQSITALPNVNFDIRGGKIVGTSAASSPIYKYTNSLVTNGSGNIYISNLEFDLYSLTIFGNYDIALACPAHPFVHQAGVDGELEMVLVADSTNTARISVLDSLGRAIPGALVNITRSGYNESILTNTCGQAFFTGGISNNNDYTVTVTATGYLTGSIPSFEINGDVKALVTLTE